MEKTKLNLPLPLPLYRGIAAEGKRAGKMIEGSALISVIGGKDDISIMPPELDALGDTIRPETLCMYIGKEDMNGESIFTNHVLKYEYLYDNKVCTEYYLVIWDKSSSACKLHASFGRLPFYNIDDVEIGRFEIIGNIHESPKLLKLFPNLQGVKA